MVIDPKEIGKIAFPDYRGRKFRLEVRQKITLRNRYWSGGTKSDWIAVNLETKQAFAPEVHGFNDPAEFGGIKGDPTIEIPPNVAIVEHIIFCGKKLGLRIFVRGNLPLPKGGSQDLLGE